MDKFRFQSKYSMLRVTMKKAGTIIIGQDVVPVQGKYLEFKDHTFITSDPAEAEFLRRHVGFGSEIFEGELPTIKIDTMLPPVPTVPINKMNKAQLVAFAALLGLEAEPKDTNEEIRVAILGQLASLAKDSQPAGGSPASNS